MAGLPGAFDDDSGPESPSNLRAAHDVEAAPARVPPAVLAATSRGSEQLLQIDGEIDELRRLEASAAAGKGRRGSLSMQIERLEERRSQLLTGEEPDPTTPLSSDGGMSAQVTPRFNRLRATLPSFAEEEEGSDVEGVEVPRYARRSREEVHNKPGTARSISSTATPSGVLVGETDLPDEVQEKIAELRRQQKRADDRQRRASLGKRIDSLISSAAANLEASLLMRSPVVEAPTLDEEEQMSDRSSIASIGRMGSSRRLHLDREGGRDVSRASSSRSLLADMHGASGPLPEDRPADTSPGRGVPVLKRHYTGGLERALSNRSLKALVEDDGMSSARSQRSDRKVKLSQSEAAAAKELSSAVLERAINGYSGSPRARSRSGSKSSGGAASPAGGGIRSSDASPARSSNWARDGQMGSTPKQDFAVETPASGQEAAAPTTGSKPAMQAVATPDSAPSTATPAGKESAVPEGSGGGGGGCCSIM